MSLADILLTVETSAAWKFLSGVTKAMVTDASGALSHAIIAGREYGIPVVAGTFEATKKIKSRDRVRVDGNLGAVWILEKA